MAKLERSGIKRILTIYIVLIIEAMITFIAGGRIDLPRVWTYFGIVIVFQSFVFVLMIIRFPQMVEVVNARGEIKAVKTWDKIFALLFSLSTIILMPIIAGLDVGRFNWSYLNVWWMALGIIFFLGSMLITEWALFENKFFELAVRIQKERGQYVVSTGPYAIVRHPGYLGMIFLYFSFPLVIGSLYALFVSLFVALLLVARTALEDKTLQEELEGYVDYTKKVKYRLMPGIW
ncbi:MAG: isoprenylcysteine carboxylmethyltransferase family protein [Candidatus Saganbacteria bacterium]|nr:isoprenylcysteine carboxylmethyltransferase family protein [Candidatus Saganbacteria bacterium]